jgi:hypothetical protein
MNPALASAAYILDSNVVSELMRPRPATPVLAWLDRQGVMKLATAAPVIWEIRYGIEILSDSDRRDRLSRRFEELAQALFADRIVTFGGEAARFCASIMAEKRALGEPLDDHLPDAMTAACALHAGVGVATRNLAEFRNTGVKLVNPWKPV